MSLRLSNRLNKENRVKVVTRTQARSDVALQSEGYLIELTSTQRDFDAQCQTDPFLERPPTPLYMPAKLGTDASTEICEGELFDFDAEVVPLLEVLIGKTLEMSMLEVLEEEELRALRERQDRFEQLRAAELMEVQRLEAAELRRNEEKQRRLAEERAQDLKEQGLVKRIVATRLSKAYLEGLLEGVIKELTDAGKFFSPTHAHIEIDVIPRLLAAAAEEQQRIMSARQYVLATLL